VPTWRCLPQEIWSSGGMLRAWRRGGDCLKRSGAREACCGPGDVEARRGVEVWISGALEVRCRRVDARALEACCRCRDVEEAGRYEGLEMRRRRVDVEV